MQSIPEEKQSTGQQLPAVRSGPEAVVGDSQSQRELSAVLYVPDADATRLSTQVRTVTIESGQTKQEAYVSALLQLIDESSFYSGSQQIRLASVSNAVETTRDLVTVNLFRSVRALSPQQQFALRVAITNTLTEMAGTNYVNILVDGRDIGIDIAETIPTGVMSRYPGNDILPYWNQLEAQRSSTVSELQRTVALYFISENGEYMLGEVRNMVLTDHSPAAYAKVLLTELSKGAARITGARTVVPMQDWFERDPVLVETEDGNYMELYFRPEIDSFLSLQDSTYAMLFSSICYTLTGFIPRLEGIIAYVGGTRVTEMTLMNGEEWVMQSGQITRESVASLAADVCTLYYPLANEAALYAISRPIAQRLRTQPRALMRELMESPGNSALTQALPESITDADILGLQIQDDTALLNVTNAFALACRGMTAVQERNMIYSIVNTLTEIEGVTRVRFFVEGRQTTAEGGQIALAGHLFIGGEFMRHPGLIYTGSLNTTIEPVRETE